MKKIDRILPETVELLHFIGIGGIGMSAIAEILVGKGYQVQGSDLAADSKTLTRLRKLGVQLFVGHAMENLQGADAVVVSSAIKADNPELIKAKAMGIPVVHRAEMLAELMRFQLSVAVGGTHGKTTTTALVYTMLKAAGIAPSVINGGILNDLGSNAQVGDGSWMVVEADESDGSFKKLRPTIAVITNIDPEHMEHYGTVEALHQAFCDFAESIPFYGLAVLCGDHPTCAQLAGSITDRRVVTYGFSEGVNYRAVNVRSSANQTTFDLHISRRNEEEVIVDVTIHMVGLHNVLNSLAAIAVADEIEVPLKKALKGLENFHGVNRRFTILGVPDGVTLVDDYAHHPVEITATLKAAREAFKGHKVFAVMQPHRFSRLHDHMQGFAESLTLADGVILLPVYKAGEQPIAGVTHEALAGEIKKLGFENVHLATDATSIEALIGPMAQNGDGVVFLGAGDISTMAQKVATSLLATSAA